MGHERPGRGAAGDRLHHRRLDLHEAAGVEEGAEVADHLGARPERPAALVADDQVHVALAVAGLGVRQPVPLVRQRPQRLRQEPGRLRLDRQLAGSGAHQRALGGDDVADVPALESLVGIAERAGLQVELDLAGRVLQLREGRLAHDPLEHHPPGDVHPHRLGLQRFVAVAVEGRVQVAGQRVAPEVVRERIALFAQARQLGAALGDQLVFVRFRSRVFSHLVRVPA